MIRPSPEYHDWMFAAALELSAIYGLEVAVFARDEIADEIWIHRPESREILGRALQEEEVNSPAWHSFRGLMCGIPLDEIDFTFHERNGYAEPCDRVEAPETDRDGL